MRLLLLTAAACLLGATAQAQQPTTRPAPAISEAELVRRLTSTLDSLAARDEFSGVVMLTRGDTRVFARAYGNADRSARRANDLETAFNIGSINKVFTTIAINQLAAEGKLHLDSTLGSVWPEYPNAEVGRRVTIRQLLQHSSGIGGNIFAAPAGGTRHDIRHNRDYLPLFVNEPLQFEPGSRRQYSNAGFVVLGALIERLSGMDYYQFIRERVTEPAGMTRTAHHPVDSLPASTALGYTRRNASGELTGALRPNRDLLPGRGSAAGGGYSTASDLLGLLAAARAGRVPGMRQAGIGVAGGAPGLNAALEGGIPDGYDLVVLTNLDPPAAERVAEMVRRWLGATD